VRKNKQIQLMPQYAEVEALEYIKNNEPPEGYFLGFSGGKDSVVLYDLALRSGVKFISYYSATGIDPPELVTFIKKNFKDVIFRKPKRHFFKEMQKRGFPTFHSRWCCDFLKKDPIKDLAGVWLLGIRAEESVKRASRGRYSKVGKRIILKPIFNFKEWEIWDYIEKYGLKYCKLYDEGFDRIGCIVCPFICGSSPGKIKHLELMKKRYKNIYAGFEKAMSDLYENHEWYRQKAQGRSMLFEEFLENWYRKK
jgi:phosphoadenosine phosphosulfate reductase